MGAGSLAATDAQVRQLAEEILRRPDYARWRVGRTRLYWLEWALDRLGAFADTMADLAVNRPLLYWLILGLLLLAFVLLIAHIVWSIRVAVRARGPVPETARPGEVSVVGTAERLAAEGRFLDAARCLQVGAIELLVRRNVLDLARADANRRLRQKLAAAPVGEAERRQLIELVDRLERRWFRDREEDRGLFEAWQALFLRLQVALS